MTTSLVPSSSAAHGITFSQNVAHDVAEHIETMRRSTGRSRVGSWISVLGPILATAGVAVTDMWQAAFMVGYLGLFFIPLGPVVHFYRRRALKQAQRLDRERDAAWVSRKDGLVFFSDDGVFIQKRGGFRPYGVGSLRFREVTVAGGALTLHGTDLDSGATYELQVAVPEGWTDVDTRRIREKLERFVDM